MSREERAGAIGRSLIDQLGPDAPEQLALAQLRIAWQETVESAGLQRDTLSSRVVSIAGGTARVEASEPILAQEIGLRADALIWAVNERMQGRPGATIVLRRLAVSVGRGRGRPGL